MYTFRDLAADATMGVETDLPAAFALYPYAVLTAHPTDWAAIGSGTKAQMEWRTVPDGLLPDDAYMRVTEAPRA